MKSIQAILIHSVSRWDQPLSSASYSLAKELSKNTLIFYIDHPFTLKDLLKNLFRSNIKKRLIPLLTGKNIYHKIEESNNNLFAVTPFVTLPINWLPEGKLYDVLWALNNWIFLKCINKIIRDFNLKKYIYFNSYNPFYGHPLKVNIKPDIYIYQTRDNIEKSNYVKHHGINLEKRVAKYADLCLATSKELTNKLNKTAPTVFFPNAANINLFKQSLFNKKDIKEIPYGKKIIGYFGNIGVRIDFKLLQKIIETFQNEIILLIGPYNYNKYTSINFHKFNNVLFVGTKKLEELPKYLSNIDCTILPFLVNDLTKSIYPLKINEYLAGGKPVVTTNFSEDLKSFEDVIVIAQNYEEFINGIKNCLIENNKDLIYKRIEKSEENSWEKRVELFWELLENQCRK